MNKNELPQEHSSPKLTAAHRRLRGFGLHLGGYFLVMIMLAAINWWLTPDNIWFVLPMVGWGSVLAIHAAYAMGLFRAFR